LLKHTREFIEAFNAGSAEESRAIRIFGDPPGTYGAGLDLALLASAWKDEDDLVKYFTQASAFAYGKGLDGAKKIREFIDTAKKVEVSTDITQSRRINVASCRFGTQVQGGYRLLAKRLGGRVIRQYQSISERGIKPKTESLTENLRRAVEDTILNEFWRESIRQKGYDGAADIMHFIQNTFSAQVVTECLDDSILNRVTEETINNDEFREWLEQANPYALEEIGRRLLELESRGKWNADAKILERLKQNYLIIEGDMEGRLEPKGDIQGGTIDIINHEGIALWEPQLRDIETELANSEVKM
jgi:cobaltochelatase CobN